MASKRRGGFRTPELRGTLGTLIRTTTGVVRDAIERGAREGRARLDDVRTTRRRHDALAELGELVLDLIRRGEIDLAELPEARDLVLEIDDLDAEADHAPRAPAPPRHRVTERPRHASEDDGTVSSGATLRSGRAAAPARPSYGGDTVSSRAQTRPMRTFWRPPLDDLGRAREHGEHGERDERDAEPSPSAGPHQRAELRQRSEPRHRAEPRQPSSHGELTQRAEPRYPGEAGPADRAPPDSPEHRRSPLPRDPGRRGGISFDDDDDDDLAEYMHPDDVPPKTPPRDPDDHSA